MSANAPAIVPITQADTLNRTKAAELMARIRQLSPAQTPPPALLDTAGLATEINRAMAPAMRAFTERNAGTGRAVSTVEIEHRGADGSFTKVKATVDLHERK